MAGKARVWYSVACKEHGNISAKGQNVKELAVARPTSRGAALKQGCPLCDKGGK